MKKINMIIALVLAVAVVMATGIMLTGCGNKKNTTPTAATTATTATTAATEKATEAAGAQETKAADNGSDQTATTASSDPETPEVPDYIDEASALENVRQQIGTGGKILSYYQGTAPDGLKAWVVTVQPVTTNDGPETVTYYTNHTFCYCVTDSEDNGSNSSDGYIDESTAMQTVKQQIGTGGKILDYYQGTTPDGLKAWVVTTQPITTNDGPDTVIYYVNYGFCYPES